MSSYRFAERGKILLSVFLLLILTVGIFPYAPSVLVQAQAGSYYSYYDFSGLAPTVYDGGTLKLNLSLVRGVLRSYPTFGAVFLNQSEALSPSGLYAWGTGSSAKIYSNNFTFRVKFKPYTNMGAETADYPRTLACYYVDGIYTLWAYLKNYGAIYEWHIEVVLYANGGTTNKIYSVMIPAIVADTWYDLGITVTGGKLYVVDYSTGSINVRGAYALGTEQYLCVCGNSGSGSRVGYYQSIILGFGTPAMIDRYQGEIAKVFISNYALESSSLNPILMWIHYDDAGGSYVSLDSSGNGRYLEYKKNTLTGGTGVFNYGQFGGNLIAQADAWSYSGTTRLYGKITASLPSTLDFSTSVSYGVYYKAHSGTPSCQTEMYMKIFKFMGDLTPDIFVGGAYQTFGSLVDGTWYFVYFNRNSSGPWRCGIYWTNGTLKEQKTGTASSMTDYSFTGTGGTFYGMGVGSTNWYTGEIDELKYLAKFEPYVNMMSATYSPYQNNTEASGALIQQGTGLLSVTASINPSTVNIEQGSTSAYVQQLVLTPTIPCNLSATLRDTWLSHYFYSYVTMTGSINIRVPPVTDVLTFVPFGNLSVGTYYYTYDIYEYPSGTYLVSVTTTLKVMSHADIVNATSYNGFLPYNYTSLSYPTIVIRIAPTILTCNESDVISKYVYCNVSVSPSSAGNSYKWTVSNLDIISLESNPNVLAFANALRSYETITILGDWNSFGQNKTIIKVAPMPPDVKALLKACGKNVTLQVEFQLVSSYNLVGSNLITKHVLITFTYKASTTGRVLKISISPTTFTGKQQEVYQFSLVLITNYVSSYSWSLIETYSYMSDQYVRVGNLPDKLDSGVVYSGTIELAKVILNQTIALKVTDIYDVSLYNSTQLTINTLGSGVTTFDAFIDPLTIALTPDMFWNLRAHVYSLDSVSRTYYMNVRNPYSALKVEPSGTVSLGSGTDIYQDIRITALSTISNGTYLVEFVFYYDTAHYLSRTVTIIVSGSGVQQGTGQTGQTGQTGTTGGNGTSPFGNQQASWPTLSITPITGAIASAFVWISSASGIPTGVIGMFFGILVILFCVVPFALLRVTSVYVYSGIFLLAMFIDIALGLFPFWIAIVVALIGVALFANKVTGFVGGGSKGDVPA